MTLLTLVEKGQIFNNWFQMHDLCSQRSWFYNFLTIIGIISYPLFMLTDTVEAKVTGLLSNGQSELLRNSDPNKWLVGYSFCCIQSPPKIQIIQVAKITLVYLILVLLAACLASRRFLASSVPQPSNGTPRTPSMIRSVGLSRLISDYLGTD